MMKRRMPIMAEIRWAIAALLLNWLLTLTQREASADALEAISNLAERLKPDPRHESEWMRNSN